MEKEQMNEMAELFEKAYKIRFGKDDVDWKQMGYGKPLAYLNWAVAWRAMKEVYPDANYRLVEDANGSPLWNINGYGMLKCAVSTHGVEHVETFPIMDNKNNAMRVASNGNYPGVDARDINDSMQRGLTKAVARFGIGLYIYEGKLETPKDLTTTPKPVYKPAATQPQQSAPTQPQETAIDPLDESLPFNVEEPPSFLTEEEESKPCNYEPLKEPNYKEPSMTPVHNDTPYGKAASYSQKNWIGSLMASTGLDAEWILRSLGIDVNAPDLTSKDASKVIVELKGKPRQPKSATTKSVSQDDYPF